MKRISAEEMYPMQVTPANFSRGDVVKKIYMDNINTPYVGVVTAPIPSTNKVEVQWPYGTGIEDPWDLIKVNPLLNPPVVKEDKSYQTYQNQKMKNEKTQSYCNNLSHYGVLNDYILENLMPVYRVASDIYNNGFCKKEAFLHLSLKFENRNEILDVLGKVYNDTVNIRLSNVVDVGGEAKEAFLNLIGESDSGYKISYFLGNQKNIESFSSYKKAFEKFKEYETIFLNLDKKINYEDVIKKVSSKNNICIDELVKDRSVVLNASEHVENAKIAELDIDALVDDIHKSLR